MMLELGGAGVVLEQGVAGVVLGCDERRGAGLGWCGAGAGRGWCGAGAGLVWCWSWSGLVCGAGAGRGWCVERDVVLGSKAVSSHSKPCKAKQTH